MKKNILLVSRRGFIGSNLTARYSNNPDIKLYAMCSEDFNLMNPFQMAESLEKIDGPLTVIFLATVGRLPVDDFHVFNQNISMAKNLITVTKTKKLEHFIFTSTACVYGRPPVHMPITEATPVNPSGHYGLSKYASEKWLQYELKCPVSIIRIPGTYGPGDKGKSIVAHFINKINAGEEVKVSGDGKQIREFLYIDDLLRTFDEVLKKPRSILMNVSSDSRCSIEELIDITAEVLKKPAKKYFTGGAHQDFDLYYDTTYFKSQYPMVELTSIKSGVKKFVDHLGLR